MPMERRVCIAIWDSYCWDSWLNGSVTRRSTSLLGRSVFSLWERNRCYFARFWPEGRRDLHAIRSNEHGLLRRSSTHGATGNYRAKCTMKTPQPWAVWLVMQVSSEQQRRCWQSPAPGWPPIISDRPYWRLIWSHSLPREHHISGIPAGRWDGIRLRYRRRLGRACLLRRSAISAIPARPYGSIRPASWKSYFYRTA